MVVVYVVRGSGDMAVSVALNVVGVLRLEYPTWDEVVFV